MSEDLIKRADAITVTWQEPTYTDPLNVLTEVRDRIEAIPSADRPQGEWLLSDIQCQEDNDNGNYAYVCTNCKHTDIHAKTQKVPYCWWCGAKMK